MLRHGSANGAGPTRVAFAAAPAGARSAGATPGEPGPRAKCLQSVPPTTAPTSRDITTACPRVIVVRLTLAQSCLFQALMPILTPARHCKYASR